jgi:DtxR family Mn-dependent transcriptional regulator
MAMTSTHSISATVEKYLENIYRLEQEDGIARTAKLAERVGVSLGTVTNTIETLERKQLVTHKPYRGVKLTTTGRRHALDVIRRHRLSERLLTDLLKMDWSHVHEYASQLEHALPDDVMKSLDAVLGHPTRCPHGNPVPSPDGVILHEQSQPLNTLNPGQSGIILRIEEERREYLEYIKSLRLLPGIPLQVLKKEPFDGPITITTEGKTQTIGHNIAAIIHIQVDT